MKKKKSTGLAILFFGLAAFFVISCNKNEIQPTEDNSQTEAKLELEKLRRFLAYAVQIPKDSVLFDEEGQFFYMHNSDMHETYEHIKYEYEISNEYILYVEPNLKD